MPAGPRPRKMPAALEQLPGRTARARARRAPSPPCRPVRRRRRSRWRCARGAASAAAVGASGAGARPAAASACTARSCSPSSASVAAPSTSAPAQRGLARPRRSPSVRAEVGADGDQARLPSPRQPTGHVLLEHGVEVGAAEAERAHAGAAHVPVGDLPLGELGVDVERRPSPSRCSGWARWKPRLGGIDLACSASVALSNPAAPAAALR